MLPLIAPSNFGWSRNQFWVALDPSLFPRLQTCSFPWIPGNERRWYYVCLYLGEKREYLLCKTDHSKCKQPPSWLPISQIGRSSGIIHYCQANSKGKLVYSVRLSFHWNYERVNYLPTYPSSCKVMLMLFLLSVFVQEKSYIMLLMYF